MRTIVTHIIAYRLSQVLASAAAIDSLRPLVPFMALAKNWVLQFCFCCSTCFFETGATRSRRLNLLYSVKMSSFEMIDASE